MALLEVRAGAPPSGVAMIERFARINWVGGLSSMWGRWERWFVDVEESHTSFPALVFFRSPQPDQSWVTAAGAVLDAAALHSSTLEEHDPDAMLCIRAGYICPAPHRRLLRHPLRPRPHARRPHLRHPGGVRRRPTTGWRRPAWTLKADRDQAWRDFVGWRVNYDQVLLALAALVMAPYAPWSSDRSSRFRPRALRGRQLHRRR